MHLPMISPKSEILTLVELAEYLKIAERTLYRLAAARKVPGFKVGGTWRFTRADIDRWIEQQSGVALEATRVAVATKKPTDREKK